MVRMFFVSFVVENFKNMPKRFILIVIAIAIMLIANTMTANCQVSKALVKVVEKGAKDIKPPKVPRLDIGKQIGISNTTYTKIGYAVKSLYDDNNKQQRPQVTNLKNDLQKAQQEAEEISAIISKFCEDLTADLPTKNRKEICNKNDCTGYHYGYENYNMQFNNFNVLFNTNKPYLNWRRPTKETLKITIGSSTWSKLNLISCLNNH